MHILVIPSWYKNPKNWMVGTFFEEQARGLMNKGHKVGLFNIEFKPFSYNEPLIRHDFTDAGLITYQYYFKGIVPRLTTFNYWYFCREAYAKFSEYVSKFGKPDILHAHSVFWGGIVARYISKRTGIPYVITEHLTNYVSGSITNQVDISFAKKVFTDSKINIVVSSIFKDELIKKLNLPGERFRVIHNMVANSFFENNVEKKIKENEPVVFFTNSFINERKNHKLLLEAFKIFSDSYPNSSLIIGGDAIDLDEKEIKKGLLAICKNLNLTDKVFFLGNITRQQVKNCIDRCHAFLLASKYETFGVVLIEALASGRPCISTNSKGPMDIITDQNGILVNSWQVDDYATAMKNLIKNYNTYNQASISEDCRNKFGEDHIIGQLITLYKEIVNL